MIKKLYEMAKICCFKGTSPALPIQLRKQHCSKSNTPNSRKTCAIHNMKTEKNETSQLLKIAVSGVTELLRLFTPFQQTCDIEKQNSEFPVSSVDDVLNTIKSDYDNAYFVTENCIFEDPTIKFSGRDLYARNLKLLVPFFECASIRLLKIEKDVESGTNFLRAYWKLRTNLKLPWKPLIAIDGSTCYELNEDFKIIRHVESWNVSALEAILQIFTFKFEKPVS
ncbi:uncharacterized protein [Cicer arietinum]|uniref:Uncharacterized protein LOC101494052 isoform X2 n=1 Tax=Cicer arietinum TaxID=3827 RepID=A0A1S2XWW9_CICAR|nr:uncharacterized protein LOC101494052 isoform X2 [Cicer arietinum]